LIAAVFLPYDKLPGMDTYQQRAGLFGTKIPSAVAFGVAIILFLLPFAEIKCNKTPMAVNSGLGIAIGSSWKLSRQNQIGNVKLDVNIAGSSQTKKDPNFYALIALALGIIGLILSLSVGKAATGSALVAGILAAGSLIGLFIDAHSQAKTSSLEHERSGLGMGLDTVNVAVVFTPWFYIVFIAFLAAAAFSYMRLSKR
jgi:hypothetical protein